MTEDGFGRCDGHHAMVNSKLKSAAAVAKPAAGMRPSSYVIELRNSRPSKKAAREPGRAALKQLPVFPVPSI